MTAKLEAIRFQKAAFRFGTLFLNTEMDRDFMFLNSLPCDTAREAVAVFQQLPKEIYPSLAKAMPRRGKPAALLTALQETLTEEENALLSQYEKIRANNQYSSWHSNSTAERLAVSVKLKDIVDPLIPILGAPESSSSKGTVYLSKPAGNYTVKTVFDLKQKSRRVSCSQSILAANGQQLNGFPLSILEVCGISGETSFELDGRSSEPELADKFGACIKLTFEILGAIDRD